MKDVKTIVSKNLSMLRKSKGLTQAELAERLNYSDKAVSRWEHGETLPDLNVLYELCSFYGITLNDLVDEACENKEEEILHNKNAKKYRIWLGITTSVVVWLVAVIAFAYIQLIFDEGYWIAFVLAVPICCVVMLYICRNIFNWVAKFVFSSICIWSAIASIYLHMLFVYNANLWTVFIIGVPVETLAFLWQKMKKYRKIV